MVMMSTRTDRQLEKTVQQRSQSRPLFDVLNVMFHGVSLFAVLRKTVLSGLFGVVLSFH